MNLMRVNKARAHRMDSGRNKFTAAAPSSSQTAPSLDLASLAEQALYETAEPEPASPRAPRPAPVGDIHYGPYRLLERIAVGGMAEVFRAKRTGVEGFEKVVAVKRILPHLSDNKEFVDMFIDEAKMVAGLTHPNIVQIFDLGKIEKQLLHRHGVRPRPRPAHRSCAGREERGLRIPLDLRRAGRQPGLLGPRVRAPQEGRARAAHADRAPRRQPAEHPHLVRGRGEADRLRHRQGRHQGHASPTRAPCAASCST